MSYSYSTPLATHYANLVIHKRLITYQSREMESQEKDISPGYETVDVKSIFNCRSWTIGAEYVGYSMFKNLGENIGVKPRKENLDALNSLLSSRAYSYLVTESTVSPLT